jgi:hypothetical protein
MAPCERTVRQPQRRSHDPARRLLRPGPCAYRPTALYTHDPHPSTGTKAPYIGTATRDYPHENDNATSKTTGQQPRQPGEVPPPAANTPHFSYGTHEGHRAAPDFFLSLSPVFRLWVRRGHAWGSNAVLWVVPCRAHIGGLLMPKGFV